VFTDSAKYIVIVVSFIVTLELLMLFVQHCSSGGHFYGKGTHPAHLVFFD